MVLRLQQNPFLFLQTNANVCTSNAECSLGDKKKISKLILRVEAEKNERFRFYAEYEKKFFKSQIINYNDIRSLSDAQKKKKKNSKGKKS